MRRSVCGVNLVTGSRSPQGGLAVNDEQHLRHKEAPLRVEGQAPRRGDLAELLESALGIYHS